MVFGFSNQVTLAKETSSTTVEILTFNDFHGNVADSGKNPGMAKASWLYQGETKENPNHYSSIWRR